MMEYGIADKFIGFPVRTEAVHTTVSPSYQEMQPGCTKNTK